MHSFNIIVSTTRNETNKISAHFPEPILIDNNYYVALKNYAIPYSWFNVAETFNNNTLKYFNPDMNEWKTLKIFDGNHDCDSLNIHMVQYFRSDPSPIVFSEYPATNRICITLKEGWKIDFTDNSLRYILGFDNKIYENNESIRKDFIGEFVAKIEKDVRIILIHCNLVSESYVMDKSSGKLLKKDVIFSLTPNKSPGSWLTESPNPRDYQKINESRLTEIIIEITDQDNNHIDFNNEKCTFTLEIKKINSI